MKRTLALLASAAMLAGCAGSRVRGKVVEGDVSYIIVAPSSDPRFSGEGLEGAKVSIRITRDGVERARGTDESDKLGRFNIPIEGLSALADKIELEISREGRVPARGTIALPAADRAVLVLLKPRT